jgi:hypothetical protein
LARGLTVRTLTPSRRITVTSAHDGAIVYASKRAWPQQRCSFSIVVQVVVGWQPAWRRVCSKPNCYVIAVRNVVRYLHSM